MKPDSEAFEIMSLDVSSLPPEQMSELIQRAIRNAHIERSRALAAMCAQAGFWLTHAASMLVSRLKVLATAAIPDHTRA